MPSIVPQEITEGATVRITKQESYRFGQTGKVASVSHGGQLVRVDFGDGATPLYGPHDLELVSGPCPEGWVYQDEPYPCHTRVDETGAQTKDETATGAEIYPELVEVSEPFIRAIEALAREEDANSYTETAIRGELDLLGWKFRAYVDGAFMIVHPDGTAIELSAGSLKALAVMVELAQAEYEGPNDRPGFKIAGFVG